jgi:hypothetical protein
VARGLTCALIYTSGIAEVYPPKRVRKRNAFAQHPSADWGLRPGFFGGVNPGPLVHGEKGSALLNPELFL